MRAGLSGTVRILEVSDIGTGVLADVLSILENQFFWWIPPAWEVNSKEPDKD
jgi:hypothetical protein